MFGFRAAPFGFVVPQRSEFYFPIAPVPDSVTFGGSRERASEVFIDVCGENEALQ